MRFPLFIAEGTGANQGALILVGLLLPIIAVSPGIRARFKKKGASVSGIIASALVLLSSAFVLHIFGPLRAWDYWGSYILLFPLALSLLGLALSIQKSRSSRHSATRAAVRFLPIRLHPKFHPRSARVADLNRSAKKNL
jgi:hypothetical protein